MGRALVIGLVSILLAAWLASCAGSNWRGVIMDGQSLADLSDEDLCSTYRWRGAYGSGDTPLVRSEVERRGIECGVPGSSVTPASAMFAPRPNLRFAFR